MANLPHWSCLAQIEGSVLELRNIRNTSVLHSGMKSHRSRLNFSKRNDCIGWKRSVSNLTGQCHLSRGSSRLSSHSKAKRPSSSYKVWMRDNSLINTSGGSVKSIRLELTQKGLELGLAEILCQKRNNSFLIVNLEGLAL